MAFDAVERVQVFFGGEDPDDVFVHYSECCNPIPGEEALGALNIERKTARAHAEKFSWRAATEQFVSHLHPAPAEARQQLREPARADQNA